jgi:hypothetical protein
MVPGGVSVDDPHYIITLRYFPLFQINCLQIVYSVVPLL